MINKCAKTHHKIYNTITHVWVSGGGYVSSSKVEADDNLGTSEGGGPRIWMSVHKCIRWMDGWIEDG